MTPDSTTVWSRYQDRLRRFLLPRVRSVHDVEDLLQDIFLKIHHGFAALEDPGKEEAWVFQIARRAVLDHHRRRAAARRSDPLPLAPADPTPAAAGDLAACLEPMMVSLPSADRDALRLTDSEGRPQRDLAEKLGLSLTGAKSRVQRARSRLKDLLLACCRVETDRRGNVIDYTPRDRSCSCA